MTQAHRIQLADVGAKCRLDIAKTLAPGPFGARRAMMELLPLPKAAFAKYHKWAFLLSGMPTLVNVNATEEDHVKSSAIAKLASASYGTPQGNHR